MTSTPAHRLTTFLAPALLVLAGCGSSKITAAVVKPATPASAPTARATATISLTVALTAADIVNSGFFTQTSDGLLGGLANTDARVFASTDGSVVVEVDVVTDVDAAGAASDYPPYQSAAASQAGTRPSALPANLGQRSNEYVGTNAASDSVASISFVEGRYIAVVTAVGSGTATPDVVRASAESIAQAQDNKINGTGR